VTVQVKVTFDVVPVETLDVAEPETAGWFVHVMPLSVHDALTARASYVLLAVGAELMYSLRLAAVTSAFAGMAHDARLNCTNVRRSPAEEERTSSVVAVPEFVDALASFT
jgi:hypothetical protein